MTVKEQQARWPFAEHWTTATGDVVAVVGFRIGGVLYEHTGRHDAAWTTETVALEWTQVTSQ